MPAVSPILSHWRKEQKTFQKNLTSLRHKLNKEAVHDLRVAIKKLRAWLELFHRCRSEAELQLPSTEDLLRQTETLFDTIGRQRDVEICLEQIAELKKETGLDCPPFTSYLNHLLKATGGWANQAIHRYRNKELPRVHFLLKQEAATLPCEERCKTHIRSMTQELPARIKRLHQLRKALKTIYYWILLLEDNAPCQPEALHHLLDDLGLWQDLEVLYVRMKHFRKDFLPQSLEEYADLVKLEEALSEKKKFLETRVRKQARKWIADTERALTQ